MKLYFSAASPFVRKVMVVLHETDQLDDVERIDVSLTPLAPSDVVRAANPLSKLPALERQDGPALYDSRVICAFLDDRANTMLYGDGAMHWDILTLEATGDGLMDAAVSARYEMFLRPEDKRWPDWADAQVDKALGAIRAVERLWLAHLAKPLSMGHIAIGCALGYMDFRHEAVDWRSQAPGLAEWYTAFSARPSMAATRPV
jgi:glutathione S-transferase